MEVNFELVDQSDCPKKRRMHVIGNSFVNQWVM